MKKPVVLCTVTQVPRRTLAPELSLGLKVEDLRALPEAERQTMAQRLLSRVEVVLGARVSAREFLGDATVAGLASRVEGVQGGADASANAGIRSNPRMRVTRSGAAGSK